MRAASGARVGPGSGSAEPHRVAWLLLACGLRAAAAHATVSETLIVGLARGRGDEVWAACTQPATLRRSADGGRSWTTALAGRGTGFAAVVTMPGRPERLAAIEREGTVWRSDDAGDQWHALAATIPGSVRAAVWLPGGAIDVVGDDGAIARSSDAGGTWRRVGAPTPVALHDVAAAGPHAAWIVGDDGTMWTAVAAPTREPLLGVAWADGHHGWAVGRNGTVLHTSDAGGTWTILPAPSTEGLRAVAALASGAAAVVGVGGAWRRDPTHGWRRLDVGSDWRSVVPTADGHLLLGADGGRTARVAIDHRETP